MNISEEVQEFIKHTKGLTVENNIVKVNTLENFYFEVEVSVQGYHIVQSSIETSQVHFDDLGQLLTTYSPEYRNSFTAELFLKLSKFS
jgi:hypothetical protein